MEHMEALAKAVNEKSPTLTKGKLTELLEAAVKEFNEKPPIDMVLHCPKCHMQHVDAPDTNHDPHYEGHLIWTNPSHKSHLCHGCGYIWRPADVPTNGVQAVKTKGKADSPLN